MAALDDVLLALVDVLSVAVALDDLAEVLVRWSVDRTLPVPLAEVDACCRGLFAEMERLGIARETGDPAEWRRRAGDGAEGAAPGPALTPATTSGRRGAARTSVHRRSG